MIPGADYTNRAGWRQAHRRPRAGNPEPAAGCVFLTLPGRGGMVPEPVRPDVRASTDRPRHAERRCVPMTRVPFTDTHVHFYDLGEPTLRYEWLGRRTRRPGRPGDVRRDQERALLGRRLRRRDALRERRARRARAGRVGTEDPVDETRWLQAFADRLGVPHGIVAYCDLAAPDAADVLRAPRGVRQPPRHPRPALRRLPLRRGLARRPARRCRERGLVWCDDPLVEHMARAARGRRGAPGPHALRRPRGLPAPPRRRVLPRVARGHARAGGGAHTVVKISGLGMCDHAWTVESLRPGCQTCIELWGTERAFFGTNWPVDRLYCVVRRRAGRLLRSSSRASGGEKAALFPATPTASSGL